MTFARSSTGLRNYRRFHDCELVIFCEGGGKNIAKDDAFLIAESETIDALYWKNRIKSEEGVTSVKVKSLGSKKAVLDLFESMKDAGLKDILFAVDSDYDGVLDRLIKSEYIRYSRGYSIENDAMECDTFRRLVQRINPTASITRVDNVVKSCHSALQEISESSRRFIFIDLMLYCSGERTTLDSRIGECLILDEARPKLDVPKVRKRFLDHLRKSPTRPKFRFCCEIPIRPMFHMQGHALFSVFKKVFSWAYTLEFGSKPQVRNEVLKAWLVDCIWP